MTGPGVVDLRPGAARTGATRAEVVQALAAALILAAGARTPVEPFGAELADLGLDAAYDIQSLVARSAVGRGRRVVGRKVGLTSLAVQRQLGVDQPDFGVLLDDMEFGDGAELPTARLIQPKVEAEVAFVLGHDLDNPAPSFGETMRAVAYAVPAIEVVDSRVRDWRIGLFDTVADNASAGLYVLGGTARKLDGLDLALCGMRLDVRGEPVATGCGAACLGHPLNALAWLARKMASVGEPLRAGQVVLSGALGPMVKVEPGEAYRAEINGLGSVTAAFAAVMP